MINNKEGEKSFSETPIMAMLKQ